MGVTRKCVTFVWTESGCTIYGCVQEVFSICRCGQEVGAPYIGMARK